MKNLSDKELKVLEQIPTADWIGQIQLGTSKLILTNLCNAKLIKRKAIPNPTRDPRKGFVYQRL